MSSRGYLKRLPIDTYRVQHRGGVGVIGATTYEDDDVSRIIVANTHTDVLIFTNKGKVYRMRGHQFPQGSRISKGLPAISFMPGIEKGENVITLLPLTNYDENTYLFFVTKNGVVKKTNISEFVHIMRNGKRCITLKEGDYLFDVLQVIDTDEIIIGASNGQAIRFDHTKVRPMGRTAAGVKGMKLDKGSHIIGVSTNKQGEYILSIGAKGIGKLTPIAEYRLTNRNAKGVRSLKVTPKTGNLVATKAVDMDDEVLIITTKNKIIRILVNQIRETGRNASGVKLINTENDDKVRDIAVFKKSVFGNENQEEKEPISAQ